MATDNPMKDRGPDANRAALAVRRRFEMIKDVLDEHARRLWAASEALSYGAGGIVIVHEATRTSGFGAELSATVQELCFYRLEAPIERVTGWDTPYPHAQEWDYFPGPARVGAALRRVMEA